ncbi:hypothetical protein [Bdellovibrio bacteriovorus]|uniref:hypothetical protein n=1 Tax=Bdellovibrio TaxID=958 RepID=UPI0035A86188
MARRTLVLSFLILLGAVLALHLSNKGEKSQVREMNSSHESHSAQNNKENSKVEPSAHVTEVASSEQPKSMSPRQPIRDPKSVKGLKTVDTSNAQLEGTTLFTDTRWKLWTGVRAVLKRNGQPQGKVLGEINGYYLVEETAANDFKNFSSSNPLVVIDTRLDEVGVVTGVFTVVLKEGVSPEVITQATGLKILNSFPNIRTYFVTSSEEPFNLQSFQDSLKGEASVEDVKMEVLSRQYEKN